MDCDRKQTAHEPSHITIRLYDTAEEKFEKGAADAVLKRLEGLEKVMHSQTSALDARLTNLEDKLEGFLHSFEVLSKRLLAGPEVSDIVGELNP